MIGLGEPYVTYIKIGILVVLLAIQGALGFYAGTRWDATKLDEIRNADLKQAVVDNAKAAAQLQQHDDAANKVIASLHIETEQRAATLQQLKKAIHAQPKTQACVSSPAIRALIDGLHGAHGSH